MAEWQRIPLRGSYNNSDVIFDDVLRILKKRKSIIICSRISIFHLSRGKTKEWKYSDGSSHCYESNMILWDKACFEKIDVDNRKYIILAFLSVFFTIYLRQG